MIRSKKICNDCSNSKNFWRSNTETFFNDVELLKDVELLSGAGLTVNEPDVRGEIAGEGVADDPGEFLM